VEYYSATGDQPAHAAHHYEENAGTGNGVGERKLGGQYGSGTPLCRVESGEKRFAVETA
jgi:hypothetical protein